MAQRNFDFSPNYGRGNVYLDFSFLMNGSSNPVLTSLRGVGADVVTSLTYAATGKVTVVLRDPFRYIITKTADLEDVATPDGAYASIGNVSGEGSSSLNSLTFVVSTWTAGGVAATFSNRRVSVSMTLKNSTVGV